MNVVVFLAVSLLIVGIIYFYRLESTALESETKIAAQMGGLIVFGALLLVAILASGSC